jgi:hypothetical protein
MSTKITLDAQALEALFKILGPEFLLQIKQGVLEEVAKRTIGAVATEEVEKTVEAVSKEELRKVLEPVVVKNDRSWWGDKTYAELKKTFKEKLDSHVKAEVESMINESIDRKAMEKRADELIKYHSEVLKAHIERTIEGNLNETIINTMIDRRIREIADSIPFFQRELNQKADSSIHR